MGPSVIFLLYILYFCKKQGVSLGKGQYLIHREHGHRITYTPFGHGETRLLVKMGG
jgi:hypothetical protein